MKILSPGILLISGAASAAVLLGSTTIYFAAGSSFIPFSANAFNLALSGGIFGVAALGTAIGLVIEDKRRPLAKRRDPLLLLTFSLSCGLAASALITATVHTMALFAIHWGLPLAIPLTVLAVFITLSLIYGAGLALLRRRAKGARSTPPAA